MKKGIAYLWTLWCLLALIAVASVLFPMLIIAVRSGRPGWLRKGHRLPSIGARAVLFLWGIRVREHGREMIDPDRQYVYVANHRSDLDIVVTAAVMRGYFKFFGKSQVLHWPLFGYLLEHLYISVNRADATSRKRSLETLSRAADTEASIMIYPEGWSNFSQAHVLPLKRGAFVLALDKQLPVAVFTITGTHLRWPKPSWRILPGTVDVWWEAVIETDGMTATDWPALKKEVRRLWVHRLEGLYPDGYPVDPSEPDFETWKNGFMQKKKPEGKDQA